MSDVFFDKNMYEEDHYSSQRPRPLIVGILRADDTLKEVLKAMDSGRTVEARVFPREDKSIELHPDTEFERIMLYKSRK